MLYDRPYMQADSDRKGPSALGWLMIAIASIFILQRVGGVFLPASGLAEGLLDWLALSRENFRSGKFWTVLTYSFLHGDFWHIAINCLIIFGIGRALQAQMGERQFLYLYFGGVVIGGLMAFIFQPFAGVMTIGASGGALALITVYCFERWEMPVTLLFFEITFKMKWLFYVILIFQAAGFLAIYIGPSDFNPAFGTSYSAHLGGILGGFLFYKFLMDSKFNPEGFSGGSSGSSTRIPDWFKKRTKPKTTTAKPQRQARMDNNLDRKGLQAEVDRILDKINAQGFGSLSEEEKKTLDRAKDILSK